MIFDDKKDRIKCYSNKTGGGVLQEESCDIKRSRKRKMKEDLSNRWYVKKLQTTAMHGRNSDINFLSSPVVMSWIWVRYSFIGGTRSDDYGNERAHGVECPRT